MGYQGWQYDVALSYASEDRVHAKELATRILIAGYTVFYDEFEELWGEDLSVKLHEIYGRLSRFCVVFISEHYLRKPWTNVERKTVLARAMQQDAAYLLPIHLDDSELPGLGSKTAFKDLRKNSITEIFESLKRVLGPQLSVAEKLVDRRPEDIIIRMHPRNFLGIVVQRDNVETPLFNLDCHLISESPNSGRIRRLEALVTPCGKSGIQFMWNVFYEYLPTGKVMEKIADAKALRLRPEESRMLGVQFVGPRMDWEHQWPVGEYEFEISGWVNRGPRDPKPDLRTKFRVEIGPRESRGLSHWAEASQSEWKLLGDSHNGVAVPVTINRSTLVVN
jgi:hypothetical protein